MNSNEFHTTQEKIHTYEAMMPLLRAMYSEFKELSKKKPDSAVNKNKIKMVNRLLEKIRIVLHDEESISFLDILEEDDMPQASDVTLMLSQYVAAMDAFHGRYYGWNGSEYAWSLTGYNPS